MWCENTKPTEEIVGKQDQLNVGKVRLSWEFLFSCVAKKKCRKETKKKIETKTKQRRNKKWKKTHEKLKDGAKKLKKEAKWWLYKCKKEAKMNDNNEMKWKIAILNFVAYLKILRFGIFNAVYRQLCLLF